MSSSIVINTALRLPAPDIEALLQGRMIVAMSQTFINPGRQFALYPANASMYLLPIEQHYHSTFLAIAQTILANLATEIVIKAWAKCELCKMIDDSKSLEALSRSTIWTTEALQKTLAERQNLFLTYLRVYQLLNPQTLTGELPATAASRIRRIAGYINPTKQLIYSTARA